MSGSWVRVASRADVPEGEIFGTAVGEKQIALYNIDGELYATDNLCTHAFAFLSDGWLDGDIIECPLHGGRFEVKTGKGCAAPVTEDVKTYKVRVVGEDVEIEV